MTGTRFPNAHRWILRFGAYAAAALALVAANLAAAQVPSVISVARAGPTPTNASSVDFTVTFSEPVTGVDAADFVLTTTGTLAGASVTGVAGAGDTRTLSVGTGTGDGTLRLDVVDDDSITDGSSNALGGAGAGNGSFSAGETYAIDRAGPAVVSVTVPANAVYVAGDNLDFAVNLDEATTVNTAGGAPFIPLTVGATPRQASYISGSGTSALFFRYTISGGDVDVDGIAVGGAIVTNGAAIRDAAGNDAILTLNGVGSTAGVLVDPFRTVTPSAGLDVSIAPSTPQVVTYGNAAVFTVTPGPRYTAVVGGTCGGALVGSTYTTNAITANCTVVASAIDSTGPAVVSVTVPANAVYVAGDNLDFAVNLDEATTVNTAGGAPFIPLTVGATPRQASYISGSGTSALFFRYTISGGDVDVDGIAVGGAIVTNGATIRDAAGNDAILTLNGVGSTAGVLVDPFRTVTPSAGPNGSIAPSTPQVVTYGNAAVFTVTPGPGHTAVVGGTCGGALVGNTYTTRAITSNCTVVASFTQTRTVTPSAGANGTISPSTPQTIADGATAIFMVTPNTGYTAAVGGTCGGTLVGNTYTTDPITANCAVVASFTQNTYTVTPSAGPGGSIAPASPQTIAHGAAAVFTLTPNTGYTAAVSGTCGGTLAGNTYTTNPITASCTVVASFSQDTYTVTPSAGANGSISPVTPQTIAQGGTATFTVTPEAGYAASVGGTCGGTLAGNTYTTNAITSNCTVAAAFNASPVTTFTAPSATGTGNITASFTGGGPTCTYTAAQMIPVQGHASSPPAGTAPAQVAFPHGLFDFTLDGCTPGSTVTMTIAYPTALPPNAWYWKYGPTASQPAPHWYVLLTGLSGTTVTFTLTDGGVGDDDLTANGTVVDQGGPGTGAGGAVQVPTLSAWAMAALSALLLLAGLRRARAR